MVSFNCLFCLLYIMWLIVVSSLFRGWGRRLFCAVKYGFCLVEIFVVYVDVNTRNGSVDASIDEIHIVVGDEGWDAFCFKTTFDEMCLKTLFAGYELFRCTHYWEGLYCRRPSIDLRQLSCVYECFRRSTSRSKRRDRLR